MGEILVSERKTLGHIIPLEAGINLLRTATQIDAKHMLPTTLKLRKRQLASHLSTIVSLSSTGEDFDLVFDDFETRAEGYRQAGYLNDAAVYDRVINRIKFELIPSLRIRVPLEETNLAA